MQKNILQWVASSESCDNWSQLISRETSLYSRKDEIRSEFERDYTRILHCLAYRRLKHKTQVFFNIDNDHICTRMEHVQHVESVSTTIAKQLGLNVELTRAIAIGHDLGHAPFGHEGENELSNILSENNMGKFWHEKNGLRIVDNIELLENKRGQYENLSLTYAVRDGIISHCGEVYENGLLPRHENIDLNDFNVAGQYAPYTWEGCVVKISDKIAYLGRDIEDAKRLNFIDENTIEKLSKIAKKYDEQTVNTSVLMHNFVISICQNSSINYGIALSENYNKMLTEIREFNLKEIYLNDKFKIYKNYVSMIIRNIYEVLIKMFDNENTIDNLTENQKKYPILIKDFIEYVDHYIDKYDSKYINKKIYGNFVEKNTYVQAIVDFISGMTDRYAISLFNSLLQY